MDHTPLAPRRRWAATAALCLGLFLLGLDLTVLNVAVPGLQADLDASMGETQWVVDAYALVLGGLVLTVGALTDRLGRRRAFVCGVYVCALASVCGAVAADPAQVIAARAGMGAGAALLMPATLSIVSALFPDPAERARAIALWTAVGGLGGGCGPVIGGWLVDQFSWRAAFWINLPFALAIVALTLWLVPAFRPVRGTRADPPGAVLSAAGLLALVWSIIESPGRGWTSPEVLAGYAGAGLLLVLFVLWERRTPHPMLPPALLGQRRISLSAGALAMMSFALYGSLFVATLYLQGVLDYSPWRAGLCTLPLPGGLIVGAALSVRLGARCGQRATLLLGLAVVAGGFAVLAGIGPDSGYPPLAAFQIIAGTGAGLIATAATASVMDAVPEGQAGLGSAVNDATRQVGVALGVAVQGSVLAAGYGDRMSRDLAAAHAPAALDPATDNILAARALSDHVPAGSRERLLDSASEAFTWGMTHAALVAGAVVTLTGLAVWRCLPGRRRAAPRPEPATESTPVTHLTA
ncbi:MFS transporter [Streptomyces sp. ODS28]|uniref:MFS transporter n=1 Tax=Streptomyces sp. ODS28 TaxID=3136688 RepID=UPI0031EDCDFC